MDLSTHFPIWDKLTPAQQKIISQSSQSRSVPRGTVLHNGSVDCLGLLPVSYTHLTQRPTDII